MLRIPVPPTPSASLPSSPTQHHGTTQQHHGTSESLPAVHSPTMSPRSPRISSLVSVVASAQRIAGASSPQADGHRPLLKRQGSTRCKASSAQNLALQHRILALTKDKSATPWASDLPANIAHRVCNEHAFLPSSSSSATSSSAESGEEGQVRKIIARQATGASERPGSFTKIDATVLEEAKTILRSKAPEERSRDDIEVLFMVVRGNKFFRSLSVAVRQLVCRELRFLEKREREELFHQGDEGDAFYLVLKGTVSVFADLPRQKRGDDEAVMEGGDVQAVLHPAAKEGEKHLADLSEGDSFGEWALIRNERRAATIRTLSPCEFLWVSKDFYQSVLKEARSLAVKKSAALDIMRSRSPQDRAMQDLKLLSDFLETMSPFNAIPRSTLLEVSQFVGVRSVSEHDVIIEDGAQADFFYLPLNGVLGAYCSLSGGGEEEGTEGEVSPESISGARKGRDNEGDHADAASSISGVSAASAAGPMPYTEEGEPIESFLELITLLEEGDAFGEWALARDGPRLGYVVAITSAIVLTVDRVTYIRYLRHHRSRRCLLEAAGALLKNRLPEQRGPPEIELFDSLIETRRVFNALGRRTRRELCKVLRLRTFEKGEVLSEEGQTGDTFFLVLAGRAGVFKRRNWREKWKEAVRKISRILKLMPHAFDRPQHTTERSSQRADNVITHRRGSVGVDEKSIRDYKGYRRVASVIGMEKKEKQEGTAERPDGDSEETAQQRSSKRVSIEMIDDMKHVERGEKRQYAERSRTSPSIHAVRKSSTRGSVVSALSVPASEGTVSRVQEARVGLQVGEYEEGESFGEWGLVQEEKRQVSVKALSRCRVMILKRQEFQRILAFVAGTVEGVAQTQAIAILKTKPAIERTSADLASLDELINQNDMFKGLSYKVRLDICRALEHRALNAKEILFHQGDVADSFFIILDGTVGVYVDTGLEKKDPMQVGIPTPARRGSRRRSTGISDRRKTDGSVAVEVLLEGKMCVAHMEKGAAVGEWALLGQDKRRSATIVCHTDCEFASLGKSAYNRILKQHREETSHREMAITVLKQRTAGMRTPVELTSLLELIKNNAFFQNLSPAMRIEVCQLMSYRHLPRETILFNQGDEADNFYMILKGLVGVYIRQKPDQPSNNQTGPHPGPPPPPPRAGGARQSVATPALPPIPTIPQLKGPPSKPTFMTQLDGGMTHREGESAGSTARPPVSGITVTGADGALVLRSMVDGEAVDKIQACEEHIKKLSNDVKTLRRALAEPRWSLLTRSPLQLSIDDRVEHSFLSSKLKTAQTALDAAISTLHLMKGSRHSSSAHSSVAASSPASREPTAHQPDAANEKEAGEEGQDADSQEATRGSSSKPQAKGKWGKAKAVTKNRNSLLNIAAGTAEKGRGQRKAAGKKAARKGNVESGPRLQGFNCVTTLMEGESFGEKGLLENAKRAATIMTHTPCEFLVVDKNAFNRIFAADLSNQHQEKCSFLRKWLPTGPTLRLDLISKFSYYFKQETFHHGRVLLKEGTPANRLYLIRDGQCRLMCHANQPPRLPGPQTTFTNPANLTVNKQVLRSSASQERGIVRMNTLTGGGDSGPLPVVTSEAEGGEIGEGAEEEKGKVVSGSYAGGITMGLVGIGQVLGLSVLTGKAEPLSVIVSSNRLDVWTVTKLDANTRLPGAVQRGLRDLYAKQVEWHHERLQQIEAVRNDVIIRTSEASHIAKAVQTGDAPQAALAVINQEPSTVLKDRKGLVAPKAAPSLSTSPFLRNKQRTLRYAPQFQLLASVNTNWISPEEEPRRLIHQLLSLQGLVISSTVPEHKTSPTQPLQALLPIEDARSPVPEQMNTVETPRVKRESIKGSDVNGSVSVRGRKDAKREGVRIADRELKADRPVRMTVDGDVTVGKRNTRLDSRPRYGEKSGKRVRRDLGEGGNVWRPFTPPIPQQKLYVGGDYFSPTELFARFKNLAFRDSYTFNNYLSKDTALEQTTRVCSPVDGMPTTTQSCPVSPLPSARRSRRTRGWESGRESSEEGATSDTSTEGSKREWGKPLFECPLLKNPTGLRRVLESQKQLRQGWKDLPFDEEAKAGSKGKRGPQPKRLPAHTVYGRLLQQQSTGAPTELPKAGESVEMGERPASLSEQLQPHPEMILRVIRTGKRGGGWGGTRKNRMGRALFDLAYYFGAETELEGFERMKTDELQDIIELQDLNRALGTTDEVPHTSSIEEPVPEAPVPVTLSAVHDLPAAAAPTHAAEEGDTGRASISSIGPIPQGASLGLRLSVFSDSQPHHDILASLTEGEGQIDDEGDMGEGEEKRRGSTLSVHTLEGSSLAESVVTSRRGSGWKEGKGVLDPTRGALQMAMNELVTGGSGKGGAGADSRRSSVRRRSSTLSQHEEQHDIYDDGPRDAAASLVTTEQTNPPVAPPVPGTLRKTTSSSRPSAIEFVNSLAHMLSPSAPEAPEVKRLPRDVMGRKRLSQVGRPRKGLTPSSVPPDRHSLVSEQVMLGLRGSRGTHVGKRMSQ
ncbi:unnamed protein product [Vitrella brassicaformis CCMP3155]|uniref:Cyclic nucleotide-binding domain-containing protein n=3 Tax=Vitrella brassicaformis TaxID=1169539 RepID=A0A0G4GM86_VITBC|nr:unnamed protein product [Vitrella brassicaformis CCMP3155]|eukprot:CEM31310.1 unnamed protein product [Vitrella brassicaformis CCMP3155]